jgi:polyisoprenyl-phosphate glycosyltransferase
MHPARPVPLLTVVIPVHCEAEGLRPNVRTLLSVLETDAAGFRLELILVNDGSRDHSLAVMEELREERSDVIGIVNLVRNFGQVPAIFAGLARARGDCVAVISADLQDPPEMIPAMFERWRQGARTVLAVRAARDDAWPARFTSWIFYSAMRRYALKRLPRGGFDFFLIDRGVVARMLSNPEPNGFLQGQVLYASGSIVELPYRRRQRQYGVSGWPFGKKLKYFIDGFIAYTFTPIRLISLIGILSFVAGIAISAVLVIQRVFYGTRAQGWTSIMIAMLLLHGLEMFMIGIVGEYTWRTLDQARSRSLYLVDYEKPAEIAEPQRNAIGGAGTSTPAGGSEWR